ncbi:hypothetical protein [Nocardia rhizosphaerae]|uniref:Uncharacterized protein n=1 Tax=Nocardia rhizosphaerae TaxID=1691571 RepID=A0ABV8L1L9_9NOCA
MTVEHRLLRTGPRLRGTLGPVELTTGGLLLVSAGLALLGPLVAALLIRRSGSAGTDTATTASLILLSIAVVLAISTAIGLFVTALRRR